MNKKILIIVVIIFLAASGIIFLVIKKGGANLFSKNNPANSEAGADIADKPSENNKLYENFDFGFSFLYPADFSIDEVDEGDGGYTVTVAKAGSRPGFQVYLLPFDEAEPLTAERI